MSSAFQLRTPKPPDEPTWLGLRQMFWDTVREAIASVPEVEAAVVFGSRAQGTHWNGSDVDICLFGRNLTQRQRWALEEAIDDLLWSWNVDLVHWEGTSSPRFREEIRRHAKPLFHRGSMAGRLPVALEA